MAAQLGAVLSSTAFFLTRVYSSDDGGICFYYVFQAPNPTAAKTAFLRLSPQGGSNMYVTFDNAVKQCAITASPWQGDGQAPMGMQLPFQWSANDLLLWGLCGGGALCALAVGTCCCIMRLTFQRDTATLQAILRADKQVLTALRTHALAASDETEPLVKAGEKQRKKDGATVSTTTTSKDVVKESLL